MSVTTIGAVCTVIGAFLGILAAFNYDKKETKNDTRDFVRVETKLDLISVDIKGINDKFDKHAEKISCIEERVTRVEESTKSAHKRIDGIEGDYKENL
jgi:septal ring factor EnvC (AmiA/AmiB activator)